MTRRIVHSLTQIRWQSAHVPPSRPGWGIGRVVVDDPLSEIHLASHARAGVRLPVRMIIYVAGSATKLPGAAVSNWSLTQLEIANFRLVGIEATVHSCVTEGAGSTGRYQTGSLPATSETKGPPGNTSEAATCPDETRCCA